jgi:peptide/nickel transport system permease protein
MTVFLAALFAGTLDGHLPIGKNVTFGLTASGMPLSPSSAYPLGTDVLGRCVASRLLHGARISLLVALSATLLATLIGSAVGLVAGYRGGRWDAWLMRAVDGVASFPLLLLAIAIAAALRQRGAGVAPALVVLGTIGWPTMARVLRAKVRAIRDLDYVHAARALGAGHGRVLLRHIFPGVLGPLAVLGMLAVPQMILAESTLSYLGLGLPPPAPAWGRMLSEAQPYLRSAPWTVLAPSAAIVITAIGFSLLGEGLREELDR